MRGQRDRVKENKLRHRIIPARAGPTCETRNASGSGPDHPRSCGANRYAGITSMPMSGSSPLVRGQPPCNRKAARPWTDHPRSCGANRFSGTGCTRLPGSSPLVRGQLLAARKRQQHGRIIPARAGPTSSFRRDGVEFWIIPARAGPTPYCNTGTENISDHPRSCGANLCMKPFPTSSGESSPLVRGQRNIDMSRNYGCRIIPARAGPTCTRPRRAGRVSNHPRSCGANRYVRR